jgi:diadenosine tetraphosphate (Ap4A) HIT family hydrolase/predicted kinase
MTCRHDRGELFSVGGVIYQDTFWHIEHITPLAVPGWLVLKPIRHVEHVADLSGDEAIQQFGPLVQLTAAALRATTNAAKVYVVMFAEREANAHIHFHLIPRRHDDPSELRGPGVFECLRRAFEEPASSADVAAAERICHVVRLELNAAHIGEVDVQTRPTVCDVTTPGSRQPLLVVFSGLPGTGKSTLADAAAEWLQAPVFVKDELEATLWRSGIRREGNSGWAGYELLTTLARGQLSRSQTAILDSVATTEQIRMPWRALSAEYAMPMRIVETMCSDAAIHRARLSVRRRGIPGWPELTWEDAVQVAARYEPWPEEHLVLDAIQPLADNLASLRVYLLTGNLGPDACLV